MRKRQSATMQGLAKLRELKQDGDVTSYLSAEHRQNIKSIEATFRSISQAIQNLNAQIIEIENQIEGLAQGRTL